MSTIEHRGTIMTGVRGLTIEQRTLAERYIPFAVKLSRRYADKYPHLDSGELRSVALEALTDCAGDYEPARNISFTTYARPWILGALRTHHRERRSDRHRPVGTHYKVVEQRDPLREIESAEAFECLVSLAPAKYRVLLHMIYRLGLSQTDAAKSLGCSQPYVSASNADALHCLAEEEPIVQFRDRRPCRYRRRA